MANAEFRLLGPGDRSIRDHAADDAFDGPVLAEHAEAFLADPAHMLVVAIDDGVVAGMVRSMHPAKPLQLWINEVGVASAHRRRGIGRALLALTLGEARRRGCVWARVASDATDLAISFYRGLGGEEEGGVTHVAGPLADHRSTMTLRRA
jgi:aminoglycoside 6'-N-acetyltransferase I